MAALLAAKIAVEPVVVGLVQITEPAEQLWYLPYSIGLLQAYVQQHAADRARYLFLLPQFQREPIDLAAARLGMAAVVGFSMYVWNQAYTLALAQELKRRRPEVLIVLGGPQVPDAAEAFLVAHPYVDVCVHGEGERTFLQLLEAWPDNDWTDIPAISWREPDGSCRTQPPAARLQDLDALPSPFLAGVFEPLMLSHPQIRWVAIWETNRGCPFSCSFCDWGSNLNARLGRFGLERLKAEIAWFARQRIDFVFCADANFGLLARDVELAQELALSRQQRGYPKRVLTQMTKNRVERAFEVHEILARSGLLISATLSLQSVTPAVLTAIRRDNISLAAFGQLLQRFVAGGIPTYTDVLIGLPGETFASFVAGIETLLEQGQHDELRIWSAYLLPNAEMAQPAYRARYGIESVFVPYLPDYTLVGAQQTEISEHFEMIVATAALPRAEWRRTRALAWLIQCFYYGRVLQLALLLLHSLAGIGYAELLLTLFEAPLPPEAEILTGIRRFLLHQAQAVSQGLPEAVETPHPDGTHYWLPPQAFLAAQLLASARLSAFYAECEDLFAALLTRHRSGLPPALLPEMMQLTQLLFLGRRTPGRGQTLRSRYNLWNCYQAARRGEAPQLEAGDWLLELRFDAYGKASGRQRRLGPLPAVMPS